MLFKYCRDRLEPSDPGGRADAYGGRVQFSHAALNRRPREPGGAHDQRDAAMPTARASAAAQHRRDRSVSIGASATYLARSVATSTTARFHRGQKSPKPK